MLGCLNFCHCNGQDLTNNQQQQFVMEAKRAGLLDEETAKLLLAYSVLNNTQMEETEKFLIADELAELSNQTRSIALNSAIQAQNKSSSGGERLAWICCCSILVVVVCVLIYERSHSGTLDGLKRDLNGALSRGYLVAENMWLKAERVY